MPTCPICNLPFAHNAQGSPRCKVNHHCHLNDLARDFAQSLPSAKALTAADYATIKTIGETYHRFGRQDICTDCNSADVELKKIVDAKRYFSFAPCEIKKLTRFTNGNEREFLHEDALALYSSELPDFEESVEAIQKEVCAIRPA